MSSSVEPGVDKAPLWRTLFWRPFVWVMSLCWWLTKAFCRFCWWCLIPVRKLLTPVTELHWWKHTASRLRMRSVPLRRWLVLCLGLLIILPILTGSITALIVNLGHSESGRNAETVLGSSLDRWDEAGWRAEAAAELDRRGVDFVLYQDGTEMYRTTTDPLTGRDYPGGVQQVEFGDGQMALIYGGMWGPFDEDDGDWPVPVVAIGTLIATFVGMGIFFGRTVVRPLAATSAAAGDIAGGDLNISLPTSRVREVAELNAAVEGMASALADSLSHEAQLEQQRRFLIGAVAHDLRTPLFTLRGSLEAIRTGVADTDEKRERYLMTAQERADMLDRLISDLFDYTRLEYLDQAPNRGIVQIAEVIRRSVDALQPRAAAKEIELSMLDGAGEAITRGDDHLLTRAIENLIDNAIRFTPEGGTVQVASAIENQSIVLSVADSGPGVPAEELPKIFDPLFRGEESRNRRTGGAGLGLTIARNVFTAHGGNLTASNGPNGGAVFVATLPIG